MRRIFVLLGLAAVLALAVGEPVRSADDKATFFNGKDTEGWEGLKEYWSVKDGAIVGSSGTEGLKFNTFLCSKKKYKDFELKFQVQLKDGKGNSGVQIRSQIVDPKNYAVGGPQCDIGGGFWGSLYGERFSKEGKIGGGHMMKAAAGDVLKKANLKPNEFNDYFIKCVGKHVTIKINGETTVDDDFPILPEEGIIAWQLHAGGPMEVTFKNIEFKELDKK